ncbi:MAG: DJ-1/PfpI family protein [Treponema sp.]|jgi:4-methyl-5(b-hydroxyethyl)-thiazole monophosphate biosynthesis|nr:DJ-1/PfpI family protein [Treponema sp.]
MAKKALVLLAPGFEEVEAVSPIDYLRRAGIEVTAAAVVPDSAGGRDVGGSHGIILRADSTLAALTAEAGGLPALCRTLDALLLPGGMPGASNLAASADVTALIQAMARGGKIVAAICASPALVLAPLGLLKDRRFTCYPGMEQDLKGTGPWSEEQVVIDGSLITSRGAGTAAAFALAIIGELLGKAAGTRVARALLLE